MAINKLPTIPKHLLDPSIMPMDDPTAAVLPQGSVTYPGSGGSFAIPQSMNMSVSIPNSNWTIPPEHTIQGQMLTVQTKLDAYQLDRTGLSANIKNFEDEIKRELVSQMLEEIVKNKCIEFTSQKDMLSGSVTYRARIFVTPNGDVQLIRKMQK